VFGATWLLYLSAIACAIFAPWWPLQFVGGVLAGFFTGTLFIVGHDACHGSLTAYPWLNRVLGRIAFLPSLTPYTSWEYAHNRVHHSYTNLRERDYAWAPFSKAEYDQLSPLRRAMERHYRSVWGFTRHYIIEYWWKHLLFPSMAERREMKHSVVFLLDRVLISAFVVLQFTLAFYAASWVTPGIGFWGAWNSPAGLVVMAVLIPFEAWAWVMSFAIFQHHNHPRAAWFADRQEWDFYAAQVENSVHMQLPAVMEWISAHIMQHTAHHANPRIPLYRLTRAQSRLEEAYPDDVIVERWSLGGMFSNIRACKLYDFKQHCWLDFAGNPTTEPNAVIERLRGERTEESVDAPAP
jgi:omega-6 fatty acid desaturase (delta-12 desaturase)